MLESLACLGVPAIDNLKEAHTIKAQVQKEDILGKAVLACTMEKQDEKEGVLANIYSAPAATHFFMVQPTLASLIERGEKVLGLLRSEDIKLEKSREILAEVRAAVAVSTHLQSGLKDVGPKQSRKGLLVKARSLTIGKWPGIALPEIVQLWVDDKAGVSLGAAASAAAVPAAEAPAAPANMPEGEAPAAPANMPEGEAAPAPANMPEGEAAPAAAAADAEAEQVDLSGAETEPATTADAATNALLAVIRKPRAPRKPAASAAAKAEAKAAGAKPAGAKPAGAKPAGAKPAAAKPAAAKPAAVKPPGAKPGRKKKEAAPEAAEVVEESQSQEIAIPPVSGQGRGKKTAAKSAAQAVQKPLAF